MIFTETSSINAYDLFYVTAVHVEDIIFHMFQYIQKLRTEGPQEWVFDECKVIIVVYLSIEVQTNWSDGTKRATGDSDEFKHASFYLFYFFITIPSNHRPL